MMSGALLTIDSLRLAFGGLDVLDGVSFEVEKGSICGLIGPNGAGKTSLLNCISGLYRPAAGQITLDGQSLLGRPPESLAHLGLSRTFQQPALFAGLTVREQILVALENRSGFGGFSRALPLAPTRWRRWQGQIKGQAQALIDRFDLTAVADQPVLPLDAASGRRVELARALALEPKLLLLDEPAAGLDRRAQRELADCLREWRDRAGLTILVIEHRMQWLRSICDRLVALRSGRVLAKGEPEAVCARPEVIETFLGATHG